MTDQRSAPDAAPAQMPEQTPVRRMLGAQYDIVADFVLGEIVPSKLPLSRESVVLMAIDLAFAEAERLGCIQRALAQSGGAGEGAKR